MTNRVEISADVVQTVLGDHWQINGQLGERKPKIVNTCSCGIEYTLTHFRALPMVGIQEMTQRG